MDRLNADPEYVARRAAKDEKWRQVRENVRLHEEPVLKRLSAAGFPGESIHDVLTKHVPLPGSAVAILLDSLSTVKEDHVLEAAVRALGAAAEPFDGRPLRDLWSTTYSEGIRFAILNTIAVARPLYIDDWIQNVIGQNPYRRKELTGLGYKWP